MGLLLPPRAQRRALGLGQVEPARFLPTWGDQPERKATSPTPKPAQGLDGANDSTTNALCVMALTEEPFSSGKHWFLL